MQTFLNTIYAFRLGSFLRVHHIGNMIRGIFLFFVLLGTAAAARSANQYVDNVIETSLYQELRALNLAPATLQDFQVRLGPSGIYRNQGQANFTTGNLTGLYQVRRRGDCSGPTQFRGELTINCTLSIYPASITYKVSLQNGTNLYKGGSWAHVGESLVSVVIAGQPPSYIGSVKNYKVDRVGMVVPTFMNLPVVFNKVLQDAYTPHVSSELYNIFQHKYVYGLGRAFSRTPMPRQ